MKDKKLQLILIISGSALILILISVLITLAIVGRDDNNQSDLTETETTKEQTDHQDKQSSEISESPKPPEVEKPTLPANWTTLSPAEQTALNPYDCPLEIATISSEDGQCQAIITESNLEARLNYYLRRLGELNNQYKPHLIAYWQAWAKENFDGLNYDQRTEKYEELAAENGLTDYYAALKSLQVKYLEIDPTEWFTGLYEEPSAYYAAELSWLQQTLGVDEYLTKLEQLNQDYNVAEFLEQAGDLTVSELYETECVDGSPLWTCYTDEGMKLYTDQAETLVRRYKMDDYVSTIKDLRADYPLEAYVIITVKIKTDKHLLSLPRASSYYAAEAKALCEPFPSRLVMSAPGLHIFNSVAEASGIYDELATRGLDVEEFGADFCAH